MRDDQWIQESFKISYLKARTFSEVYKAVAHPIRTQAPSAPRVGRRRRHVRVHAVQATPKLTGPRRTALHSCQCHYSLSGFGLFRTIRRSADNAVPVYSYLKRLARPGPTSCSFYITGTKNFDSQYMSACHTPERLQILVAFASCL